MNYARLDSSRYILRTRDCSEYRRKIIKNRSAEREGEK